VTNLARDRYETFLSLPEAELWLFILIAQVGVWWLLGAPVVQGIREVRAWRHPGAFIGGAVVLGSIWIGLQTVGKSYGLDPPIKNVDGKIGFLTAVAALVVLGALWVTWTIHSLAERALALRPDGGYDVAWLKRLEQPSGPLGGFAGTSATESFLRLRALLERCLALQGIVIGGAILGAAALRSAVLAWERSMVFVGSLPPGEREAFVDARVAQLFPFEHVLLYGLVFSGVLAVLFIPTFLRLRTLGRAIRDAAAPAPASGDDDFVDAYRARQELTAALGIEASVATTFRAGVVILAPLATSVLGSLFER
jgi:hypothetical protein